MLQRTSGNPFERLCIPPEASNREVVERGREWAMEKPPAERIAIREAVESIIIDPLQRIEHELLTFPGAAYREEGVWEQFASRWQRLPFKPEQIEVRACAPATPLEVSLLALWRILPPPEEPSPRRNDITWKTPDFPDDQKSK